MVGNIPFLLRYGHVLGALVVLSIVGVAALWGPKWRARMARASLDAPPTPRTRIKYAIGAALVSLAMSSAFGWFGIWLATKSPTLGLRWAGVLGACMTPLRSSALEAAQDLLGLELVGVFPEDDTSQYYRRPLGLGDREAARYVELSRLRKDCEKSPDTLASLAVTHADITERAAARSLECQRPLDLSRMAEARFWEGDFPTASSLFDRAKITWGETDKDQPYAQNLVIMRSKKEIFTHWLAGRFDRAGSSIDRLPKEHASRFECIRRVLAVIANEPDAMARLHEKTSQCPVHVAMLEPGKRKQLLASNEREHDQYLYQSWAMDLEPLLAPGVSFRKVALGSSTARLEAPHELLSFPSGARRLDPAIVLELLARVEGDKSPTPSRRLVRARLATNAAISESLLGEHAKARHLVRLARSDLSTLAEMSADDDDGAKGPSSYQLEQLQLESRYAGILEAAIELRAGQVDRAASVSAAIPALTLDKKDPGLLDSEVARLSASSELVRAFIQLSRGKSQDLITFVGSAACGALSGCFIVKGDVERLAAAARGEVAFCEETACLVAAQRPDAHDALIARVDDIAGMAAVSDEPLGRLYRIGQARTLAQAIGETERMARFDRWYGLTRPIALDPRLAVARKNLESIN